MAVSTILITATRSSTASTIVLSRGAAGADGADGIGVPAGGTTGQALVKASETDYDFVFSSSGAGDLIAANNLSDLASAATARTNLGLGTAATTAAADYATAAQGTDERVPTAVGITSKFSANKATIIDADKVAIFDSAATDAPKHTLFSLIKSTLKTYFDTIYAAALGVDDNYVTDAEKVVIGNTSGTNTGDQDLSGYALSSSLGTAAGLDVGTTANLVVQLNAAAELPAVSGANLTNLPSGSTQLSDLSDVNTSAPTNRNVLIGDGVDFESRALVEADISDLGTYLVDITGESLSDLDTTVTGAQLNAIKSTVDGLGTASTAATGDFATAAQGTTADSAIQPGDISGLTGGTTGQIATKATADDYDLAWSDSLTVPGTLSADHIHGNMAGTLYIHVKNTSGGTLAKGTPVYVTGHVGASDRAEVAAADQSDSAKMPAIAILEDELLNNGEGNGVIVGEIRTFDTITPSYALNDELFVGAGSLTSTSPTSGTVQSIATVGRLHATTGVLVVNCQGQRPPSEDFAPALGADDNYVTDAEKVVIGNTSGTNTGDQDLSGYLTAASLDTLAEVNAIIADATLIDTGDARLSDSRTCDNTFDNAATAKTALALNLVENTALSTWAGTANVTTIGETAVTAHEAALSILGSQITGIKNWYSFKLGDETTDATVTGERVRYTMPAAGKIHAGRGACTTTPTGAALTLDLLNDADTSIYSTRPAIATGGATDADGTLTTNPTTFAKGDIFKFHIDVAATTGGEGAHHDILIEWT